MFGEFFLPKPFFLERCRHCNSLRDKSETSLCCSNGTCIISEDLFPPLSDEYIEFAKGILDMPTISRELNNLLSFTSLGTSHNGTKGTTGWIYRVGNGPSMYGLNGRTFHSWRPLTTNDNLFTMHPKRSSHISQEIVDDYRQWMLTHNALGQLFKTVSDLSRNHPQLSLVLHPNDQPTHSLEPFTLCGNAKDYLAVASVECVLFPVNSSHMIKVPSTSSLYDSAQYPLLFPTGWGGWWRADGHSTLAHYETPKMRPTASGQKHCTTVAKFIKYISFQQAERLCVFSTAYQQWVLDAFSRWQSLTYTAMSNNQNVLNGMKQRIQSYSEIARGNNAGRPFMLPVSVPGSPAAQKKLIADGMSVIAKLGKPTLFITFTANSQWPEFTAAVEAMTGSPCPSNAEALYPDLLVRIFRQKLLSFEDDLRKKRFFPYGVIYLQRTIETQKRFVPHAHLIVKLDCPHPVSVAFVDSVISTRLFYHEHCPLFTQNCDVTELRKNTACQCDAHILHRHIFKKMRHTKCTDRCKKKNGEAGCKYNYPHVNAGTQAYACSYCDASGYWRPRRLYACDDVVVSYNPKMVFAYQCHINVEVCAGIHVVRYIRKYISKLPCSTRVSIQVLLEDPTLEFKLWQKLRHVGVSEALIRIKEIDINLCEPAVTALKVHLEGEHPVYYDKPELANEAARFTITQLMRYFSRDPTLNVTYEEYYEKFILNQEAPRRSERAFYQDNPVRFGDFPKLFACERTTRHIARIDVPCVKDVELNAFVAILRRFPCFSWQDCKTVNGELHSSFSSAAGALGIYLGNDEFTEIFANIINPNIAAWDEVYRGETDLVLCIQTPHVLRRVFVCLALCGACAFDLFENFYHYMALDCTTEKKRDFALHEISLLLLRERLSLSDIGLAEPEEIPPSIIILQELNRYPTPELHALASVSLSRQQKSIMTQILNHVHQDSSCLFYIGARAGRGKTRLANAVISTLRLQQKIVMIGCPSAKAATHYLGAMTLHKLFGIPFEKERAQACNFLYGDKHPLSQLLCASDLICIDEFAMTHQMYVTFIDNFLRYITGNDILFGGKRIVLLGDFSQLAPVDCNNLDIDAVSPLFHSSFRNFRRFTLSANFRQRTDPQFGRFGNKLAEGHFDGVSHHGHYDFNIPRFIPHTTDIHSAYEQYLYFSDFPHQIKSHDDFLALSRTRLYSSTFIAFTNAAVNAHNTYISQRVSHFLRQQLQRIVANEVVNPIQQGMNFATPDFMIHFDGEGIPPHDLYLFIGCPVYLIRNFLPSQGLVNGAKFLITEIHTHHVKAINISANTPFFGRQDVFFRFSFPVSQPGIAFSRRQFPFREAFSATVHKLQGDTVPSHGVLYIDAMYDAFCHAQLYVALTRAQRAEQLFVVTTGETLHSVTHQALVQENPNFFLQQDDEGMCSEDDDVKEGDFWSNTIMDWTEDYYIPQNE